MSLLCHPFTLTESAFGKSQDFWTNVFPSSLTERLASDIGKFGLVLNTIKPFEAVFALLPNRYALLCS